MEGVSKKKFATSAVWKTLETFSAKGISMLVSIVLSRILMPEDYGVLTMTAVFTGLSDILIDGGFSTALIRKKDVDEYDYCAVFSISSLMALILYVILYFSAPYVADYYHTPELNLVLRVVGIVFFLQSFTAVQNGIINRNMRFRLLFVCNAVASILSGVIGILCALYGWGVWALVVQRLTQQLLLTIIIFSNVKARLSWKFDFVRIREMLGFSVGVVGASLLNYIGGNIYNVAIGKKYSLTDLGYYDKGGQLPMQFSLYLFGALSSVLLPTLASSQNDLPRVSRIVRKTVGMTSFLIMPLMAGMAAVSKELIVLLFTEKWLPSVSIMHYSCIYYLATPYMLINIQVFFALGHSNIRVKTETIRLALLAISLYVFGFVLGSSMNDLALVGAVISVLIALITYIEVRKLIQYEISEVIQDIGKPLVASLCMIIIISVFQYFVPIDSMLISLICKVIIGVITYTCLTFVLKIPERNDILDVVRRKAF